MNYTKMWEEGKDLDIEFPEFEEMRSTNREKEEEEKKKKEETPQHN